MAGKDETPEELGKKIFVLTAISTVLYAAAVVIWIL